MTRRLRNVRSHNDIPTLTRPFFLLNCPLNEEDAENFPKMIYYSKIIDVSVYKIALNCNPYTNETITH